MWRILLVAGALLLTACQDTSKLQGEIAELRAELQKSAETISALERKVAVLDLVQTIGNELPDAFAVVDCTQRNYDLVRTRLTMLTVACRDASKYLDGYKFKLEIGNPSSARLDGLKLTFTPVVDPDKKEGLQATIKPIVRDITNSFAPGSWTNIEVAVPGLPEAALKDLQVRVQVNRIVMIGR